VLAWPWFPFVAAIYPLWFIYLYNIGQVSIRSVIAASVVAIAVVAIVYLGVVKLTRSRAAAAIGAMIIVVAFYLYGPLHARVITLSEAPFMPGWLAAVVRAIAAHGVFSALLLAICVFSIMKLARRYAGGSLRLTGALNVGAATLALVLAWRLGNAVWQDHALEKSLRASDQFSGRETSVLGYNPDIYYIIVDGYARADVLRDHYEFDNTPFLSGLASRGFAVNDHSSANYYWTFLSLASSLNYDYLQNFAAPVLADPAVTARRDGFARVARMLQDNRASHYLRSRGYRFVHLQSSAPETVRNPFADEQVGCAGRLFDDEYFRTLAEITWVQALGSLATERPGRVSQVAPEVAGRPGFARGAEVRVCALPSSSPSIPLRPRRQCAQARHGFEPVRLPGAPVGRQGGVHRAGALREPEPSRGHRPHQGRIEATADHHRAV
jgi:hypothetical protein